MSLIEVRLEECVRKPMINVPFFFNSLPALKVVPECYKLQLTSCYE